MAAASVTTTQTPGGADLKCSVCHEPNAKECVTVFGVIKRGIMEERYQVKETSVRCQACFLKFGSGLYCEIRCGQHKPLGECHLCYRNMCDEHYLGNCTDCKRSICTDCGTKKSQDECVCKPCEMEAKVRQFNEHMKKVADCIAEERKTQWIEETQIVPRKTCTPSKHRPSVRSRLTEATVESWTFHCKRVHPVHL